MFTSWPLALSSGRKPEGKAIVAKRKSRSKRGADVGAAERLARWLDNSEFAIGLRLAVMMNLIVRPYAVYREKYGLPIMDWRTMMCIAAAPGATAQDIADFGGFEKMTISVSLKRLIAQGLVARQPDPVDGRRMLLRLTPRGWAVYRAMAAEVRGMESKLLGRLDARARARLGDMLDRLIVALRAG